VLVLHGWGGCIDSMAPVSKVLADSGFMAVVPDFPGHGATPPPGSAWGIEDYTAEVIALLDDLKIEKTDIVAHSFGARVAVVLAARHPSRVRRMVLTGAAGVKPRRSLRTRLRISAYKTAKKLAAKPKTAKLLLGIGIDVKKRAQNAGSADYRAITDENLRASFVRVINTDLTPLLRQIAAPTVLLWGQNDADTPLYMGKIMQKRMQDAALIPLEGTHFAYLEQAVAFNKIMLNFFCGEGGI